MVEARFDDVSARPAKSFRFTGHVRTISAITPEEVRPALASLEEASRAGLWAAGYLAYEAAPGLDPALTVRERAHDDVFDGLPLLWFGVFEGWEEAPAPGGGGYAVSEWRASVPRSTYEEAVERVRAHIRAGDVYQVNHTFRLRATLEGDDRSFYADLLDAQRASHCAFLDIGRYHILSASPEMFFRAEADRLTTRPMKGTAPRGRWLGEDLERARALVASPKERAENAMIVDLLRNDMGRISEPASVRATDLFRTERYETVWQLTSTVESRLSPSAGVADTLGALFPSGSVTGAPKVRAMQVTAELEDSPRGVYTGAIGYLAPAGARERMFFNVAIRTVVLDTGSRTAEFGVGGGITHDSTAAREYEECLAKARVLTERRPDFELLESIRCEEGAFLWLERHLDRLASSAVFFDFRLDMDAVRMALDAARSEEPRKVRLTLARDGRVAATATPIASGGSVTVAIDDRRVDPLDVFLFHKTTRREVYDAAATRHPEVDDVILVNDCGEITEATSSNVLARIDGRWYTPPRACGLLAGVHRDVLLESGEVAERVLLPSDLLGAERIELANSVRLRRTATLTG